MPKLAVRELFEADRAWISVSRRRIERACDLLIACTLLLFVLPLIAATALALKWESSGPIFERHEHAGPGGRHFTLLRFRGTAAQRTTRLSGRPEWGRF